MYYYNRHITIKSKAIVSFIPSGQSVDDKTALTGNVPPICSQSGKKKKRVATT